ncbi:hypothetical protein [Streptomyces botrytidirepellens]|uniref:hypothetical protein n=1 Tax=Streptomyces botrytidirepellens TaxID=2486417 RepID=UPI001621BA4E|nr:hypothetical protein [Streptomyces botrytidirepellens]
MGTQHVIAVGLTQAPTDGRWAADARAADRTRVGHGGPRRTRPSAPPGDAA